MCIGTDADLGYAFDDYIGFDSTRRMGITYNGKSIDGSGQPGEYGLSIPMMGMAMVELPGDVGSNYVPAGSFGFYGNPLNPISLSNDLRITYPNSTYGISEDSECRLNHLPGDRRFVTASGDLNFAPGQTKKMAAALVVCANAGGCPNVSFSCINDVADTAWKIYHNPPSLAIPVIPKRSLHIYPNPTTGILYIDIIDGGGGVLRIYDALGKDIAVPVIFKNNRIDINTSGLANGVYTIRYQTDGDIQASIFVKE